jgi:hypothetical protein
MVFFALSLDSHDTDNLMFYTSRYINLFLQQTFRLMQNQRREKVRSSETANAPQAAMTKQDTNTHDLMGVYERQTCNV